MASRATQAFATGVKFLGGANAQAYTLEFLTPTSKYTKGSFETVIVPYIELGRENCLISFGNEVPTVSRKHAAIERNGKETIIKNLSKTNPTLVNGRPVINQYYLNSGDEIQLSIEGPKLRFNESQNGTAKMAFTKRMNLVMKQAIKPYKRALIAIAVVFLLASIVGGYFLYQMKQDNEEMLIRVEASNKQHADSLAALNALNKDLETELFEKKGKLQEIIAAQEESRKAMQAPPVVQKASVVNSTSNKVPVVTASAESLVSALKEKVLAVYLTKIMVEWNGNILYEDDPNESVCSGFLLSDGTFVTARQCIDMHALDASEMNFIANSGGKVTYHFKAISPDEKVNITFTNHDMIYDTSADLYEQYTYEGIKGSVKIFDPFSGADWAFLKTKNKQGIAYDRELSGKLDKGAELFYLGYSYGSLLKDRHIGVEPYIIKTVVSNNDPQLKYRIVSANEFNTGNAGGPLFYIKDKNAVAVAIVSGKHQKRADNGPGETVITPLANLRNF